MPSVKRDVFVLTATNDDVDRAHRFYDTYGTDALVPRTREDVAEGIAGRATILGQCGGEVIAIASNFEPNYPYVELGGTLVAPPFRGFGLQKMFFAARFSNLLLSQGSDLVFATSIKPWARDSIGSALATGFEPWSTPAAELLGSCTKCPKRVEQAQGRCCAGYYKIPPERVLKSIVRLLDATEMDPCIELHHRERPDDILRVSLFTWALYGRYRIALRQMVTVE